MRRRGIRDRNLGQATEKASLPRNVLTSGFVAAWKMGLLFSRAGGNPAQQPPNQNTSRNGKPTQEPTNQNVLQSSQFSLSEVETRGYIQDLTELGEYLQHLSQLIGGGLVSFKVAGEALDFDNDTLDSYITALKVKAEQLNGIRLFLILHPDVPETGLLRELLNDVEPRCREMSATLTSLRGYLVVEDGGRKGLRGGSFVARRSQLCPSGNSTAPESTKVTEAGSSEESSPTSSSAAANQPVISSNTGSSGRSGGFTQVQQGNLCDSNHPSSSSSIAGSSQSLPAEANQPNPFRFHDSLPSSSTASAVSGACGFPVITPCSSSGFASSSNEEDDDNDDEDSAKKSLFGGNHNIKSIKDWRENLSSMDPISIIVNRSSNILSAVIPKYETMKPNRLRRLLSVKFDGEDGSDMGALTREFFLIVFESVVSGTFKGLSLLEGERGHLIPNALVDPRAFVCLGRMIVHAIMNECRGLPGLSPAIVHFIVNDVRVADLEESLPPLSVEDVADPQLKLLLEKYEKGQDLTESEKDAWVNWMAESNCARNWENPSSRQIVIQHLLVYYVFMKRNRQILALKEGLKSLGLVQLLIKNQSLSDIGEVFPSNSDLQYSPASVSLVTRGDYFDPTVFEFFQEFLQDLHNHDIDGFCLPDLIQFVTSSPYLPDQIVVSFRLDITIPIAHACNNEIVLPASHLMYPLFREAMVTALQNGITGFQLE